MEYYFSVKHHKLNKSRYTLCVSTSEETPVTFALDRYIGDSFETVRPSGTKQSRNRFNIGERTTDRYRLRLEISETSEYVYNPDMIKITVF
ncbi:MAG: hypothetical protein VB118_02255 [Oscillospiraceae bacterium]|nr:hypothetical protein [Oscillospiraceae bacterium]